MIRVGDDLTLVTLLRAFRGKVVLTWVMILLETTLMALVPLFIGFAIDDLLGEEIRGFAFLTALMVALVLVAVIRRIYDTRVYGTIRVELGFAQVERSPALPVSALNARVGMGRELVDFLEHTLPEAMAAVVQLFISLTVLYVFSPVLAAAAGAAFMSIALLYGLFHGRFYRLNAALNGQAERQVCVLEGRNGRSVRSHLLRLRRFDVALSDTEAVLYGIVFVCLLGLILFNLWYAALFLVITVGTVFSIISYSWEFVESSLALPMTLQSLSRLAEISRRLNAGT